MTRRSTVAVAFLLASIMSPAGAQTTLLPAEQLEVMPLPRPFDGSRLADLLKSGDYELQGDLVLPRAQTGSPAGTVAAKDRHWPGRILPTRFEPSVSKSLQKFFFKACKAWKKRGVKIKCTKSKKGDDFVLVSNEASGCWSGIGFRGGIHRINLQGDQIGAQCWRNVVVRHEIGHRLGLYHEQSRADRDTYVQIKNKQIPKDFLRQFDIVPDAMVIGPYDFQSIMHYAAWAFAKGNSPTIVPRSGFEEFAGAAMGPQTDKPTKLDYAGAKELYKDIR